MSSTVRRLINRFKETGIRFKEMRREFWGIQIINFLDSIYAFAVIATCTLFLSNSLGFGDVGAGAALSWLGILTFAFGFAAGPIVDRFGVRKSLFTSIALVMLLRLGMVACGFWTWLPYRAWIFLGLLGIHAFPNAIKGTAYQIGVKYFTPERSRTIGFRLWYLIMNLGAVGAGLLVHWIDQAQPGVEHREYVGVFITGLVTAALSFVSAWLLVRGKIPGANESQPAETSAEQVSSPQQPTARERFVRYLRDVVWQPTFARMMAAMALTLGVRMVFFYWSILSPKYWKRTIGPDAAFGLLESINPFIVVVGLVWLILMDRSTKEDNSKTYSALTRGSFVAASSLLLMSLPWYFWGSNLTSAYYLMSTVAIVLFSVGEIMFSPCLSQYIVAIAPKGQEGIYSSFAAMPFFLAKTAVGFLSGLMLIRWCPETRLLDGVVKPLREVLATKTLPYQDTPEAMWLILAVAALIGPIAMVALRKWFLRGMHDDPTATVAAH